MRSRGERRLFFISTESHEPRSAAILRLHLPPPVFRSNVHHRGSCREHTDSISQSIPALLLEAMRGK